MKISYKWLCEIIPGLEKVPAFELANKLTFSGLEVEELIDLKTRYSGIVVGEVVEKSKHPNADKLNLCKVSTGSEEFQVVCGAPNVTAGKKYPFATTGTVMPDGLVIKPVKLRKVDSFGMLCSAKELELSSEHEGLLTLSDAASVGTPVMEALGLDDVIFVINITPNRGDALSQWGVAKDVAALTGLQPHFSKILPDGVEGLVNDPRVFDDVPEVLVNVHDQKNCPRYTTSFIRNVKVGKSPDWLAYRLQLLGVRSINNVVDATNYVMLLTGHPVHSFDAAKVHEYKITVSTLNKNEKFLTLDGEERQLLSGDVVISDADRIIALGGIMGGEESGVEEQTKDLILEVAFFEPDAIRKTSRRLGLQTESSYRFSRFVNPESVYSAHILLRNLILTLAGGEAGEVKDFYPNPFEAKSISLPKAELPRILGIKIEDETVEKILQGLGCEVETNEASYKVQVPIGRSDLERPIDLIEEIARINGLDKIPMEMPAIQVKLPKESLLSHFEKEIKDFFVMEGFSETIHYSFGDAELFKNVLKVDKAPWLNLKNPISEDLSTMRPSLLPQLLSCYKKNHLYSDKGLRLFELRNVFRMTGENGVRELPVLSGLYTGNAFGRNRFGLDREADFFDGKGLLTKLFENARLNLTEKLCEEWPFHPGQSQRFCYGSQDLGKIGALHPKLLQGLKIKQKLYYFEIDAGLLVSLYKQNQVKFNAVPDLPPVYRDLALLAPKELTHEEIKRVIEKEKPTELKHIELFDLYEGDNIPEGKKSLAYSFTYESTGKSLTDEQVNEMHFGLVERLKTALGVELR